MHLVSDKDQNIGLSEESEENMHCVRVRVRVPLSVAQLLKHEPFLISSAVEVFHDRDIDSMMSAAKMEKFLSKGSGEELVLISIKMSLSMYSQLVQETFQAPECYPLPPRSDASVYAEAELGMKIAFGFEMMYRENLRLIENAADHRNNSLISGFSEHIDKILASSDEDLLLYDDADELNSFLLEGQNETELCKMKYVKKQMLKEQEVVGTSSSTHTQAFVEEVSSYGEAETPEKRIQMVSSSTDGPGLFIREMLENLNLTPQVYQPCFFVLDHDALLKSESELGLESELEWNRVVFAIPQPDGCKIFYPSGKELIHFGKSGCGLDKLKMDRGMVLDRDLCDSIFAEKIRLKDAADLLCHLDFWIEHKFLSNSAYWYSSVEEYAGALPIELYLLEFLFD